MLTVAYTPCPNDTFVFTAWAEGQLPDAPPIRVLLEDIETLNHWALEERADVIKVSFHALGHLLDRYVLLRSGGALGRGCGPLLVAREEIPTDQLAKARIAIPGRLTTAALLLRLFAPEANRLIVLPFDRIMPAVQEGRVDAGLIIHESRFTYPRFGLRRLVDLGEWWEKTTGHPIPLGAIVARRQLGAPTVRAAESAIRESLRLARSHPEAVWDTVRRHAQEMEDEVMRQHIALYVNAYTEDYGPEGEAAIRYLLKVGAEKGIFPSPPDRPLFPEEG